MKNFTIKLNKNQIKLLLDILRSNLVKNTTSYVLFTAKVNKTIITCYNTGNATFSGPDVTNEVLDIKEKLGIKNYEAIGSDEVGTGDLFGPIVVCSCYVRKQDFPLLEKLNARDSKKLNDDRILEIGKILISKLVYTYNIMSPSKINDNLSNGLNLNKIKAIMHNDCMLRITKSSPITQVILDQFCPKDLYFSYLKELKEIHTDINFATRAEELHISVAAASIIARYYFLKIMQKYSSELGIKLPKGAGDKTTQVLCDLLISGHEKVIAKYTKNNFKNVQSAIALYNLQTKNIT